MHSFWTVSSSDGWLKLLHDQNPGLSSQFNPKFAVEFADFSDSELLTIVAGQVDKGTVVMPWRVKLHALKQLGRQRAVETFVNARAVRMLMVKVRTQQNT